MVLIDQTIFNEENGIFDHKFMTHGQQKEIFLLAHACIKLLSLLCVVLGFGI